MKHLEDAEVGMLAVNRRAGATNVGNKMETVNSGILKIKIGMIKTADLVKLNDG